MILTGTIVNVAAICAGALVGRYAGRIIPARIRQTVMVGLGLSVVLIGLQLALKSKQPMIVIGSLILGGILGELMGIEARLESFGLWLQGRCRGAGDIAEGFVAASLLFCVGAMAIMGALQDAFSGTPTILYAKAALDGVASIALASTLGIGVLFSALPVALYQGGITLAADSAKSLLTGPVVSEMNAVGGLLIVAIGLDLVGIKRFPVGNLLPAVFVAVGLVWLFGGA
ncbi:DUF554 domain-containing protein [Oryzomonas japonica]|uniref:DUF554 domain-containing protein n=1 Tax=Oryzomonas japonica TaxID=2603858 RepID=A0A7J4ZNW5_9BACT|nr:DUF554 domain-containing protein [Oryzomonas japonica]KAB0664034.1 DUF554 domain-containing protein [Oryzomonas japonica]